MTARRRAGIAIAVGVNALLLAAVIALTLVFLAPTTAGQRSQDAAARAAATQQLRITIASATDAEATARPAHPAYAARLARQIHTCQATASGSTSAIQTCEHELSALVARAPR